jgi:hypothetical protein
MATVTGITAAKADEILGMSVVSGTINPSGHLILTRENGSTIDAGDFSSIITDIAEAQVATEVAAQIPNYVAGTTVNKGNVSGAVSFSEFNSANLVNAMIRIVATGNLTINTASLPSSPKPNTQFAVKIQQDATGGRTLTLTGFKKSQGVLALTPAPNAIDIVVFLFDGVSWYAGLMGADFK